MRARLVSAIWPARNWSRRLPASSLVVSRCLGNVSTRAVQEQKTLSRSLRRNSLEPRPQPPDHPGHDDKPNRNQWRPGQEPTEHGASPGIIAQELQKISSYAVKEKISGKYLAIELFSFQHPHQDKKIRHPHRRFE